VSGGGRGELAGEEGDAAEGERGGERGTVGVLFGGGGGEEGDDGGSDELLHDGDNDNDNVVWIVVLEAGSPGDIECLV